MSAARASDGSWGAIYTPISQSLTIDMSGFTPHLLTAFWLDPTVGSTRLLQPKPLPNTGSITVGATPGTNAGGDADWVLVFEPFRMNPCELGTHA